jgi:acetolactate synthase small subunit
MKSYSVVVTEYGAIVQIAITAANDTQAEQKAKQKPGVTKVHKVWELPVPTLN